MFSKRSEDFSGELAQYTVNGLFCRHIFEKKLHLRLSLYLIDCELSTQLYLTNLFPFSSSLFFRNGCQNRSGLFSSHNWYSRVRPHKQETRAKERKTKPILTYKSKEYRITNTTEWWEEVVNEFRDTCMHDRTFHNFPLQNFHRQ